MKKIIFMFCCLFISSANAVPITYEGELFDGVTSFGSISDPFDTGSDWWFFDAEIGDVVTITVNRLDANLDPAFNFYAGLQADTSSLPTTLAFADDDIAELPGLEGPWSDPQLLDFTITVADFYTVAVWDFASGSGAPFDYQITLTGANPSSVPEPASFALIGLGLAGIGFSRKKKVA